MLQFISFNFIYIEPIDYAETSEEEDIEPIDVADKNAESNEDQLMESDNEGMCYLSFLLFSITITNIHIISMRSIITLYHNGFHHYSLSQWVSSLLFITMGFIITLYHNGFYHYRRR